MPPVSVQHETSSMIVGRERRSGTLNSLLQAGVRVCWCKGLQGKRCSYAPGRTSQTAPACRCS